MQFCGFNKTKITGWLTEMLLMRRCDGQFFKLKDYRTNVRIFRLPIIQKMYSKVKWDVILDFSNHPQHIFGSTNLDKNTSAVLCTSIYYLLCKFNSTLLHKCCWNHWHYFFFLPGCLYSLGGKQQGWFVLTSDETSIFP